MSSTQDNVSYEYSMSSDSAEVAGKPYLKKELLYVIDNNGSQDYSRNQVEFETVSLSNNGKWADYKNGFISIPCVGVVERSAGKGISAAKAKDLIRMKASNASLIDSMITSYGNVNVVQENPNICPYLIFKQHTTMSLNDVEINKHTGYRKDDSDSWGYADDVGIYNNKVENNESLQEEVFVQHDAQKAKVVSNAIVKSSGENTYSNLGVGAAANELVHVFDYDCIIRLKDLPFFEKMILTRGGNIKITLKLNQFESTITNTHAGGNNTITVTNSLRGSSVPLIRCESDGDDADKLLMSGAPDVSYTEKISLKVVQNGAYTHEKKQCRLYVPTYTMSPTFEKSYLSQGEKTIVYEDVFMKHIKIKGVGGFQELLTNSLSRMQKLIIVPMLSASANGALGVGPAESLFATEPSTCSPYSIKDFNVQLSGSNLYQQSIEYKYEHYLNEMNGNMGVNANLETGLCSSMISSKDYNSNYGYIVCDLSRRYDYDDKTPLSLQIKGTIASGKELDLLCYVVYKKDMTIDLSTGARKD